MKAAKLSSKFQITLPKQVREDMKVSEGDRIIFIKKDRKWIVASVPSDPVEALKYLGKKAGLKGTAKEVHREMEEWEK